VIGSEGGFVDGEGAFGVGSGVGGLAEVFEDQGEVVQVVRFRILTLLTAGR
jgi:hypothetical protein